MDPRLEKTADQTKQFFRILNQQNEIERKELFYSLSESLKHSRVVFDINAYLAEINPALEEHSDQLNKWARTYKFLETYKRDTKFVQVMLKFGVYP